MQQIKGIKKIGTVNGSPEKNVYTIFHTLPKIENSQDWPVFQQRKTMQDIECGNSVFYDLKNNPNVNWRSLPYLVALRFKNLSVEMNPETVNEVHAFIADDSPIPKSGIKTELVSRVHDHVSCGYIFGYKILVLGYWDGLSFYPLDFSLHREKGRQAGDAKQRLETANKRLSAQRQKVKELTLALATTQQTFRLVKKANGATI